MAKDARRANGEGSFSKLPSGKIRYQVYIDGKRKSFTGRNESDCRNQYKKFLRNRDVLPLDTNITLRAWMHQYLETYRKGTMKDTSYHTLELLRDKIPDALAGKKLCDVRPAELQQFVNDYAAGGASESYTQKMCSMIRSAMEEAVENDLVAKNPARKLKTPHKQEKPRRGYTADEARKIIQYAREYVPSTNNGKDYRAGKQIAAAVCALLITGMRRGELLGLMYHDLDREAGTIHIRRAVSVDLSGVPYVEEGKAKTEGSIREVPAPAWLIDMINGIDKRGMYPFGTSVGTLMSPRNFNRAYKSFMEKIDVPYLSVHCCRHTCATLLQSAGADIRVVQLMLGHTQITTTARYTHPSMDALQDASNAYLEIIAHA